MVHCLDQETAGIVLTVVDGPAYSDCVDGAVLSPQDDHRSDRADKGPHG